MKKKEKIVILVLLVITIVLVVVGVNINMKTNNIEKETSKSKSSQTENNTNTTEEESEKEKDQYIVYLDDGTKVNSSEKMKKSKDINGMTLSNIQLTEKDNMTVLLAKMKNNSNETKENVAFKIVLLDDAGNEMVILPAYIQELKAGETGKFNTQVSGDYSNAYDYKLAE